MKKQIYLSACIFFLIMFSMVVSSQEYLMDDFECGNLNCYPSNWTSSWSVTGTIEVINNENPIDIYQLRVDNGGSNTTRTFNMSGVLLLLTLNLSMKSEDLGATENLTLYYNNGTNSFFLFAIEDGVDDDNTYRNYSFNLLPYGYSENSSIILARYDGGKKGYADEIKIYYDYCIPNWVNYNSSCGYYNGTWDKFQTYYLDSNECGTNESLPANNGTLFDCDYCSPQFSCQAYNQSCGDTPPQPEIIYCENLTLINNATCCAITGLDSDCNESYAPSFDKLCGDIYVILEVLSYPYVEVNVSYPMYLYMYQNNVSKNLTDFLINLTMPDSNSSVFNFTWDGIDERFEMILNFTEIGNYPFNIYAVYPYDEITNITGTFIVRDPFDVCFRFLKSTKNYTFWSGLFLDNRYINNYAYVTAEFNSNPNRYIDTIEPYFAQIPDNLKLTNNNPVFWGEYEEGEATLKLYEKTNYIVRLIDGEIAFSGNYSIPNVTQSYGTNAYIGQFYLNQTECYTILLTKKDLSPFTWLLNIILIVLIVLAVFGSIALIFVIPQYPVISIFLGLVVPIGLVILRGLLYLFGGI